MTFSQATKVPLNGVVLAVVGAQALGRPVYRPVGDWIGSWRISQALDAAVSRLPAYVILMMLAVPFAVAEPMKIIGVYWMGSGHVVLGLTTIVLAYGTSVLVVERIYKAGKPKLQTIGWFARLVAWAGRLKEKALEGLRETRAWKASQVLRERLKA